MYQKHLTREAFFFLIKNTIVGRKFLILFSLFLKFSKFDFFWGVFADNSTFSIKKVGVPLTRRSAAGLRRASNGRHENYIRVRGSPHYFDLRVRGTPTFFTENVEFSSRLASAPDTPPSKIGTFKKSEKKSKLAFLL